MAGGIDVQCWPGLARGVHSGFWNGQKLLLSLQSDGKRPYVIFVNDGGSEGDALAFLYEQLQFDDPQDEKGRPPLTLIR